MTRPRLLIGLAIPIALALAIALILFTSRDTTTPPTPTVAASTSPPTTQQPADQWLTIVRQIIDERHALYQNPQPELLNQIYDMGCPCYEQEFQQLGDLQRRGLRYNDRGTEVQQAKLIGRARDPSKRVVAIEITSRQFAQVLVDGKGKVVQQSPGTPSKKNIYELIRGSDGRWRVYLIYKA